MQSQRGKTVLVTGSSGYLGSALCAELISRDWCHHIHGMDLALPAAPLERFTFHHRDVNDPGLASWVASIAPDVLVHLAFVLKPAHDEAWMHHVNVEGTRNVLRAAERASIPHVVVASSGTAYGAFPDNPVPLREADPVRPHPSFAYARQKAELEADYEQLRRSRQDIRVAYVRPCVVYGPRVSNYLSNLLTAMPVIVGLRGHRPPLQFVHEDDVVRAMATIIEHQEQGPFNVAPPDTLTMPEILAMTSKPSLLLPERLISPLFSMLWTLGADYPGAPPSFLDFLKYPWAMDCERLRDLGFEFQHSSTETVRQILGAP